MNLGNPVVIVLSTLLLSTTIATAQPQPTTSPQPAPTVTVSVQEQDEFKELKEEKRIRELVEESIYQSQQLSDRVQSEVDRAFGVSTTLLNILLVVLTALPIVVAVGVWFLRPKVISQLHDEVKEQFKEELKSELEDQKKILNREIRELKNELSSQLIQLSIEIAEAQRQRNSFKNDLEALKKQFESELFIFREETKEKKDKIFREVENILQSSPQKPVKPDQQQQIQKLKNELEELKSQNPSLFSAAENTIIQLISKLPILIN